MPSLGFSSGERDKSHLPKKTYDSPIASTIYSGHHFAPGLGGAGGDKTRLSASSIPRRLSMLWTTTFLLGIKKGLDVGQYINNSEYVIFSSDLQLLLVLFQGQFRELFITFKLLNCLDTSKTVSPHVILFIHRMEGILHILLLWKAHLVRIHESLQHPGYGTFCPKAFVGQIVFCRLLRTF